MPNYNRFRDAHRQRMAPLKARRPQNTPKLIQPPHEKKFRKRQTKRKEKGTRGNAHPKLTIRYMEFHT